MRWITSIPKRPFLLWGYFPIDCEGPSGMLPKSQLETIYRYDRRLAYSAWAAKMIDSEYLPHGIDTSIYYPRPKKKKRGDLFRIGICATNTPRKDWALAAETCSILKEKGRNIQILAHTDQFGHLPDLFAEFGLTKDVILDNTRMQEEQMAAWYRLCDVTLAIGAGEGFGYPIAESLACGIPCIHGYYAGGAEITDDLVLPVAYRYDGLDKRPVFHALNWATAIHRRNKKAELPPEYDWNNLWPRWKQWLLDGVK